MQYVHMIIVTPQRGRGQVRAELDQVNQVEKPQYNLSVVSENVFATILL